MRHQLKDNEKINAFVLKCALPFHDQAQKQVHSQDTQGE
jgi:hypothetical protein